MKTNTTMEKAVAGFASVKEKVGGMKKYQTSDALNDRCGKAA